MNTPPHKKISHLKHWLRVTKAQVAELRATANPSADELGRLMQLESTIRRSIRRLEDESVPNGAEHAAHLS